MTDKIKLFFILSLLLNALLIGVLGGQAVHQYNRAHGRNDAFMEAVSGLEPGRAEKLRAALKDSFRSHRDLRKGMRKARETALEILSAPTFDAAAYQRQLDSLASLRAEMMRRMAESVKEMAKDLTPEERAALAEMIRQNPHCRKRW